MSEWQPIETAPRDGTHVILWMGGTHSAGGYEIAAWFHIPGLSEEPEWWAGGRCLGAYPGIEPTHWMPLPEPPA